MKEWREGEHCEYIRCNHGDKNCIVKNSSEKCHQCKRHQKQIERWIRHPNKRLIPNGLRSLSPSTPDHTVGNQTTTSVSVSIAVGWRAMVHLNNKQKHNPPSKILECEDDNERATLALQRTVVRHKHPCVNAKDTTST